jgi:hypothetical protein
VAVLVLATLSWVCPAQSSSRAVVHIQAVIKPWLKFSAIQPNYSYRITSEDIRRGHIDLPRAITISVQTNVREPIRFGISGDGPERILVQTDGGFSDSVSMDATQPSTPVTRIFDMRIVLPENAREGSYPLTVALSPMVY